jgi:hypothetical protein
MAMLWMDKQKMENELFKMANQKNAVSCEYSK